MQLHGMIQKACSFSIPSHWKTRAPANDLERRKNTNTNGQEPEVEIPHDDISGGSQVPPLAGRVGVPEAASDGINLRRR